MRSGLPVLAAAALLGLLLGACGRPSPLPESEDDPVRWWPSDVPASRPYPLAHRELAALDLPQAAAAGPDEAPPRGSPSVRWVVNLEADGHIYFKGQVYDLVEPSARDAFRKTLALLARGANGFSILLRIDRLRPWGDVRELIEWTTTIPDTEVEALHFAVDAGGRMDGRIEARSRWLRKSLGRRSPDVVLDIEDGPAGAAPRVQIGDRTWRFAPGDPYARGPSLDAANAAWVEIRGALREAGLIQGDLSVDVDPRVPWAHVVQLFALAQLVGKWRVAVDRTPGMSLSVPQGAPGRRRGFGLPWATPPLEPGERDPRDASPLLLVSIGVALAALVVLVPLARPRLRRGPPGARPRPPRPPASPPA